MSANARLTDGSQWRSQQKFQRGRKVKGRRADSDSHGCDGDGVGARWHPCLCTRHAWNHPPRPSSSCPQGLLQSAAIEIAPTVVF